MTSTAPRSTFLRMPVLPVAGFLWRLAAFVMDLLILYVAINVLSNNFLPAVVALDRTYSYLTGILTFLYFALMNGPVGKGRTLGKMAVGLVATDYAGGVPNLAQGILRTAILFPSFFLSPIYETVLGRPATLDQAFIFQVLVGFPLMAMFLATMLVIPFNPYKQGLHDYAARTLVQRVNRENPTQRVAFGDLTDLLGAEWLRFHRQPQLSGVVTFVLVMVLLAVLFHPGRMPAENRRFADALDNLRQMDGFRGADIGSPYPMDIYVKYQTFGPYGEGSGPDVRAMLTNDIGETTGTISLVAEAMRNGKWRYNPTAPEYRAQAESLVRTYHATAMPPLLQIQSQWESPLAQKAADEWNTKPVVLRLLFVEELISVPPFFRYRNPVGAVSVRFDPLNLPLKKTSSAGS